jgi:hypothetical protein
MRSEMCPRLKSEISYRKYDWKFHREYHEERIEKLGISGYLDQQHIDELESYNDYINEAIEELRSIGDKCGASMSEIRASAALMGSADDATSAEKDMLRGHLDFVDEKIRIIDGLVRAFSSKSSYAREAAWLEKDAAEGGNRERYREKIDYYRGLISGSSWSPSRRPSSFKKDIEESMIYNMDIQLDMFGRSTEIFARLFNSLYDQDFDPKAIDSIQANEEDLRFFESLRSGDGKPLLRKGIEKRRFGQKMLSGGRSPEEIRHALEYATGLTYDGVEYSWPSAEFRIKGELPIY